MTELRAPIVLTAESRRQIAYEQIVPLKGDLSYWKRIRATPESPMWGMAVRQIPLIEAEIARFIAWGGIE